MIVLSKAYSIKKINAAHIKVEGKPRKILNCSPHADRLKMPFLKT